MKFVHTEWKMSRCALNGRCLGVIIHNCTRQFGMWNKRRERVPAYELELGGSQNCYAYHSPKKWNLKEILKHNHDKEEYQERGKRNGARIGD